jgi:predicted transcriptional regulator
MGGNMTPKEIANSKLHETNTKILNVLECGPLNFADIAERIGQSKNNVRIRINALEEIGCVELSARRLPHVGRGNKYECVATLVDRSKYIYEPPKSDAIEDEPEELAPHIIQSPTNPHCKIYMNLNRPARKEDLRKLNLAWHGYSCEISV